MDDAQLDRFLRSMGKGCFRDYYHEFVQLPRPDMVRLLMEEQGYTENSAGNRTSRAKSIIRAGRAEDALRLCADAPSLRLRA